METENKDQTDDVGNLFDGIGIEDENKEKNAAMPADQPTPEPDEEQWEQLKNGTYEEPSETAASSPDDSPKKLELVEVGWDDDEDTSHCYVVQKVGTVALLKVDFSQKLFTKPYENNPKYPYYCLENVEFHKFVGTDDKQRVADEKHLVWQLCKTAKRQLRPVFEAHEGWKFVLAYRANERRSIYRVLSDEEVLQAKSLGQEELVREFFSEVGA